MEKLPLMGAMCRGLQSLFISRGADEAGKQLIVEEIKERQQLIEDEMEYTNPICIFPETTTSNGKCLLKFKRGAFEGLRTVSPVYAKINNRSFIPTYDVLEFLPCWILYLSSMCMYNLKLTIMPEFTPT